MKIGFIGAGKVGFSLGKFFTEGGVRVTGYYSRHAGSAAEAAEFTGTKKYDRPEDLIHESDAIFLTVPDGSINSVYEGIKGAEIKDKAICHCSGSMTAGEVFPDIGSYGARGYSIHPLFPISSKYETYRELPGAFFCLEGDSGLEEWAQLIHALGPEVQLIDSSSKVRYHAACAIASNLMCSLVYESLQLLETCGFTLESALKAITPLMRSNIGHIIESGPVSALTGPVERCDTGTVAKHMDCFSTDDEREMYRVTSKLLVRAAKEKNPNRDYSRLSTLLDKEK